LVATLAIAALHRTRGAHARSRDQVWTLDSIAVAGIIVGVHLDRNRPALLSDEGRIQIPSSNRKIHPAIVAEESAALAERKLPGARSGIADRSVVDSASILRIQVVAILRTTVAR